MLKYLSNTYKILANKITEMQLRYVGKKYNNIREEYDTAFEDSKKLFEDIKNSTDIGEMKLLLGEIEAIKTTFDEV